jgi:DNA-directed RNA polymerase subunit RPC12/RpoP
MKLSEDVRANDGYAPGGRPATPPVKAGEAASLEAAPVDDRPYEDAWAEYRAWWRGFWIGTVGGWFTIAALAWLLPGTRAEPVLAVLFPIWGLAWFVSTIFMVIKLVAFACPRCGNNFFNPLVSPVMQWKCQSCGLRKFAVNDRPSTFRKVP